jgi:hypothetical protein
MIGPHHILQAVDLPVNCLETCRPRYYTTWNVYLGHIPQRLLQPDLMLSEHCLQCTGIHIPPTFRGGIILIHAIFATAGIECVNAYILHHKGGVGNHRCFILNFTSSSIIG